MIAAAAERLAAAGCDAPELDAHLLLAYVVGMDRAVIVMRGEELRITAAQRASFDALVERRARREPIAYIRGEQLFRYISLLVDRRVLIPRPDTETLVEVALEAAPTGGRVHDVGTGSGAVALALVSERPDLQLTASDASWGAVEVFRANAAKRGADVPVQLARGLPNGDYDLVVANLPYVREDEWDGLQPEIRLYEPREALVSGPDGLEAIRELIEQAPAGQLVALEHAPAQAAAVRDLLRGARTVRDLGGRERVTIGTAP